MRRRTVRAGFLLTGAVTIALLAVSLANAAVRPPLPAPPTPTIPLVSCGTAQLANGTFTAIKVRAMSCGAARLFLANGGTKATSALYTSGDCTTKNATVTFTASCSQGRHTLQYTGTLP